MTAACTEPAVSLFLPPFLTLLTAYWCGTVLTWQVAEPSSHSSMVGMTQL